MQTKKVLDFSTEELSGIPIGTPHFDPQTMAKIMESNSGTQTYKEMLQSILEADKPSDSNEVVDHHNNPLGNAPPLQLVKALAQRGGYKDAHPPHEPNLPSGLIEDL